VPQAMLDTHGAVYPGVASAMANGVRRRLGATFGVATTGVAGPDPAEGKPVGTVYIAATRGDTGPGARQTSQRDHLIRRLDLAGSRNDIRGQTVTDALALLLVMMREETR
jgi:PncC family amidohydrolase